ncbi:MAG: tetratricopeptide repeat protein [Bacteroidales bacterium]|nr:tetratricopeptide repeat protein [Bacteroidales bacterium]
MKKHFLIIGLILCLFSLDAQEDEINYEKMMKEAADVNSGFQTRTEKYETLFNYYMYDLDTAKIIAREYWKLCKLEDNQPGLASCSFLQGKLFYQHGQYKLAQKHYNQAIEIYTNLNNSALLAETEKNLAFAYEAEGDFNNALIHYINGLKQYEKINDKKGIASGHNGIGSIYLGQNKPVEALKSFEKALSLLNEDEDPFPYAFVINNMGLANEQLQNTAEAMDFYQKGLQIMQKIENPNGEATCLNNIANLYAKNGAYKQAEDYYKKILSIQEKLSDYNGIARTYANLGVLYQDQEKFDLAREYIEKAINLYEEIGNLFGAGDSYASLSGVYESTQNYKKALESFKTYNEYNDIVFNENQAKRLAELQELHNAEQREKEIELHKKQGELKDAELEKADEKSRRQTIQLTAATIGFVLILILAIVVLRGYRAKKKANITLAHKNEEITHQKEVIEEKNKDIMDSIKYAKRIQTAILPPEKVVKETLDNSFILFKPKDIVSGDFYWMTTFQKKVFFAAVDCTGHGVPGAFVSIIGHNGLKQAVSEYHITTPGKILDKLNMLLRETLRQTDKTDVKDGMDLGLVAIDFETQTGEFAGANNPLYLIRKKGVSFVVNGEEVEAKNENEEFNLFELKATKQPIGAYEDTRDFENNEFPLLAGDRIYVFSDGYADQFGGPKNKKFKYSTFKELLLETRKISMTDQKEILNQRIEEWMNGVEQVDDICIIGVEI